MLPRQSLAALIILGLLSLAAHLNAAENAIDFARDIRPIFAQHCFKCHDNKKQVSGYSLEARTRAFAGGESGEAAIAAGKSADSPLFARVVTHDDGSRMPPEGAALAAGEIELLRRWIDSGASWPDELSGEDGKKKPHWAFIAPERSELPEVSNTGWCKNAIDRFVLAHLEAEHLTPSPEADRTTLVRRLSLDLTGLPPTIAEVDAFLADTKEGAYERAVERLLASPRYGERQARHWLDAARYADSDGYEKDKPRPAWFYRDWVIASLNADMPYDQFVISQIAGDLLPNASQDQIVATGFLRNSMTNEEGGVDPEQFRMEAMFDRMDAIGKSVLGLTIQCAQCHNHKFDPLTQEEYYRIFALLNDAYEANVTVYTADEQMRRADIFSQINAIETRLQQDTPDWADRLAAWERSVRDDQPEWTIVVPDIDNSGGEKFATLDDQSILGEGYSPSKFTLNMTVRTPVSPIRAIRLELLTNPNLPRSGPGRSAIGSAALTEFQVKQLPPDGNREKAHKIKIESATSDINPTVAPLLPMFDDRSKKERITGPIEFAIDNKDDTAWTTDTGPGRRNQPCKAVFVLAEPLETDGEAALEITFVQNHGGWNSDANQTHNLGRFRLAVTAAPNVVADPLPAAVREILTIARPERTPRQTAALFSYWRTTVREWKDANAEIEQLWQTHPEGASQLTLVARDKPRETHLLKRGDFLKPERTVEPGVPAFLHPLEEEYPTRLSFAKWLVDRRSPTTARSLVNRVWQAYFGTGIVATSEDLGTQSEMPSHPALLDYLAVELMEHNWSLKDLHRQIVLSATYRQSSRISPELASRDPYNRLLARGARFRVEAEVVRDLGLAAAGLLSPRIGGPSVYPPLPAFMLLPPVSYGPKDWPISTGEDRYRRAMYTFRYRSLPYPALQAFDAPNGDFSCVRRVRSNTPLQALTTLNEPISIDCARALASRALVEVNGSDQTRLTYAFRLCVAREPTATETAELERFLTEQRNRFADGLSPLALAGIEAESDNAAPSTKVASNVPPGELAAWTAVARVLMNLDETITKE